MASTQILKQRIRSVKNTKQITKAMQLVSASKMRRAQEMTKSSAPYSHTASQILADISRHGVASKNPLFNSRPIVNRLIVLIASDKGLAGAYNSNLFKAYTKKLKDDQSQGINSQTIAIGKKAAQFVSKLKSVNVVGVYDDISDKSNDLGFKAVFDTICDMFVGHQVDAVDVIYTEFISSAQQQAKSSCLLPAGAGYKKDEPATEHDITYEPSPKKVLAAVVRRLVEALFYQNLLEAKASEHSMRMVAMKNATDNATDLIDDLTLAMNKLRQGSITQELAEISGGVEALNA